MAIGKIYIADVFLKIGGTSSQYLMADGSVSLGVDISTKANIVSPTFSGTVVLPSTTSIGLVSSTEISYLDGVTSNIQTQLNGKITANTSTNNYIPKVSGTNTFANSRLFDDGTYLGIGTTNTPTKDITLGNSGNREIGIEQSENTSIGKNLSLRGGRTIDFTPNSGFQVVDNTNSSLYGLSTFAPNGDILFGRSDGNGIIRNLGSGGFVFFQMPYMYPTDMVITKNNNFYVVANTNYFGGSSLNQVYEQVNRIGVFNQMVVTNSDKVWISVTTDLVTGDVYFAEVNGNIYKRTSDTGDLVSLGVTPRSWNRIRFCSDGSLYATLQGTADIYKMTNVTGDFIATGSVARDYTYITTSSNGDVLVSTGYGTSTNIYKKQAGESIFTFSQTSPVPIYALLSTTNGSLYFCGNNSYMYFQNNDAVGSPNLAGGTLKLASGTGKGTGDSNLDLYTGQKTTSGTDMQIETLRVRINNEGLMTLPSTTNALIEADVTGKAVVTKEYVSNRISEYKTYFINSSTGNNTTGVYQDATKPFATIDYVLSLPTISDNDVIYLQGSDIVAVPLIYPLNNQIPDINLTIKSEEAVTLDLSANSNYYSHISSALLTKYKFLNIYLPNGEILNNRAGVSGMYFYYVSGYLVLNIKANKITLNTNNAMFALFNNCTLEVNTVSVRTRLFTVIGSFGAGKISIGSFECLANNASLSEQSFSVVTLNQIYGSGSYFFIGGKYNIGNISTTGTCTTGNNGTVTSINFMDSTITSVGGIDLGSYYGAGLLVTGVIKSIPILYFSGNEYGYNPIRIINFSADIGAGYFNVYGGNVTIENSSIKSTNSPLMFWHGGLNTKFILKNSSFEVVNAVPLVGGFIDGASASIVLSGVSTNATSITTVPNVTVTQFTNY